MLSYKESIPAACKYLSDILTSCEFGIRISRLYGQWLTVQNHALIAIFILVSDRDSQHLLEGQHDPTSDCSEAKYGLGKERRIGRGYLFPAPALSLLCVLSLPSFEPFGRRSGQRETAPGSS